MISIRSRVPTTAPNVLERDYDRTVLLPTVDLARAMWEVRDAGQKQWAVIFMEMSNAGFRSRYWDRDRGVAEWRRFPPRQAN